MRFLHYFEAVFARRYVKSPQIKLLRKIRISPVPGSSVKLFYTVYNVKEQENEFVYSNRNNKDQVKSYSRAKCARINLSVEGSI